MWSFGPLVRDELVFVTSHLNPRSEGRGPVDAYIRLPGSGADRSLREYTTSSPVLFT